MYEVFGDELYQYNASSNQNTEMIFIDIGVFREIIKLELKRVDIISMDILKTLSRLG